MKLWHPVQHESLFYCKAEWNADDQLDRIRHEEPKTQRRNERQERANKRKVNKQKRETPDAMPCELNKDQMRTLEDESCVQCKSNDQD